MILAVDTETTGTDVFHGCRPFMVTACDGETNYLFEGQVNPYTREVFWDDEVLQEIQLLLDSASTLIFHNTTFDVRMLASIGIKIDGFWGKIEDTLIASHCICSGDSHNLKDLAVKYCHYWDDDEELLDREVQRIRDEVKRDGITQIAKEGHHHFPGVSGAGTSWYKMDMWLAMDACREYGTRDAERTFLLWRLFNEYLYWNSLDQVYRIRCKLLKITYDMTSTGLNFYYHEAVQIVDQYTQEMEVLRQQMKLSAGITYKFDPNKRDHLVDMLHTKLKIPVMFYTKAENSRTPCVDKHALAYYENRYAESSEAVQLLSQYRAKQTKRNYIRSWIAWVAEDGRIHSNVNITGTRETRQSSSSPNQMNIDKALLHLWGPPPGYIWMDLDMVNIELRIWTYEVGNQDLIKIFEAGGSVHLVIAEILHRDLFNELGPKNFKQRIVKPKDEYTRVKNGNFARIYGATNKKANDTYGVDDACSKIDTKFPEIGAYSVTCIGMCDKVLQSDGVYAIYCLGGYRLDVPREEPFKATNYRIQGTAGWIMNLAMIAVVEDEWYDYSESQIVAQVHDSMKIEIPIQPKLDQIMESYKKSIEAAGRTIIPTCEIEYKVMYNPADEDNPHIQKWVCPF